MEQGNPIWVESLLTDKEYAEQAKIYPGMYSNGNNPQQCFHVNSNGGIEWGLVYHQKKSKSLINALMKYLAKQDF
jgi:hypothetical protein